MDGKLSFISTTKFQLHCHYLSFIVTLDNNMEGEKDSQTQEEPSMITNSELRSIDLNVLGE